MRGGSSVTARVDAEPKRQASRIAEDSGVDPPRPPAPSTAG